MALLLISNGFCDLTRELCSQQPSYIQIFGFAKDIERKDRGGRIPIGVVDLF